MQLRNRNAANARPRIIAAKRQSLQQGRQAIPTILVVDYDMSLALSVHLTLRKRRFKTEIAGTVYLNREAIEADGADVAIIDTSMLGVDVLHASRALARTSPGIPVIVALSEPVRRKTAGSSSVQWRPRAIGCWLLRS